MMTLCKCLIWNLKKIKDLNVIEEFNLECDKNN